MLRKGNLEDAKVTGGMLSCWDDVGEWAWWSLVRTWRAGPLNVINAPKLHLGEEKRLTIALCTVYWGKLRVTINLGSIMKVLVKFKNGSECTLRVPFRPDKTLEEIRAWLDLRIAPILSEIAEIVPLEPLYS